MDNEEFKKSTNQDDDDDYDDEMDTEEQVHELSSSASKPVLHTSSISGIKAPSGNDPLIWSNFYDSMDMICDGKVPLYKAGNEGHIFLCLHAAGNSALSFAPLAKQLKAESTCIAFDFRGHGMNIQEDPLNMSAENLIKDTIAVIKEVAAQFPQKSIVLVGHSLGGSIAVKTINFVSSNVSGEEWVKHLQGVIVIDVVEGSTMEALPFMEAFLIKRPKKFQSLQQVIQYGLTSKQVKDPNSARVSMPGQVVEKIDEATNQKCYEWRTDLIATKVFWTEWFQGLSAEFLQVKVPKVLLLANSERLDQQLTNALHEGRFTMEVVKDVGHTIHEDNPLRVTQLMRAAIEQFHIQINYAEKLVVTSISGKQVVIGE